MKEALALILTFTFAVSGDLRQTEVHPKGKDLPVHFVVINMSGAARELHHRGDIVPLPIATRVPLQVPAGDSLQITSHTDKKVEETIAIAPTDEGRTIPIH